MQTESKTIIFLIGFWIFSTGLISGQSTVFGFKGGPVIATQSWSTFQRQPLLDLHGILFIESWGEDEPNAFFAQIGYHTRGSSLRQVFVNPTIGLSPQTRSFKFHNLALTVAAKRKLRFDRFTPYYTVGLRGEYNISTNLNEFRLQNTTAITSYPQDEFVVPFTYGLYAGGGFEFNFTELIGGQIEVSVNPDLSRQYFQPPLSNVIDPVTGRPVSLSEREIRNTTLEISLGLRFLRKVVYVD